MFTPFKAIYPLAALLLTLGTVKAEDTVYQNPVDGTAYTANWKTYKAKPGSVEKEKRDVGIKGVRLLSTQEEFDKNIEVKELSEFIKATQLNIEQSVGIPEDSFELLVDTVLSKDKDPAFSMASQGTVSEKLLQKIEDGLKKMKGYHSRENPLKYQVHFEIKKKV